MSCCYPKSVRLRTRRQYQRLAQQSKRHVGQWVVVDVCPSRHQGAKLGITVSRHYGIAVRRNRFKRIVREAFRLCRRQLRQGIDINVKPRQMAREAKTADVLNELVLFLGKPVLASI